MGNPGNGRVSPVESLAGLYHPDEEMEALRRGWEQDRRRFERTVPSSMRICLGIYLLSKRAWEAEQAKQGVRGERE